MGKMTKVYIGWDGQDGGRRFWMDGTPGEIFTKLQNRFKIYTERPVKSKNAKVARQAKEKPAPRGAAVVAA